MAFYNENCTKLNLEEEDKELLIKAHEKLVHTIIHTRCKCMLNVYSYDEIFQTGVIGLYKAIQGYDTTKGFAFSTFAYHKILGEIMRFNRDDLNWTLKIPRDLRSLINRYKMIKIEKPYLSLEDYARELNVTIEELEEAKNYQSITSLNLPVNSFYKNGESQEITLVETISSDLDFEEQVIIKLELEEKLLLLKEKLSDRDYKIIMLYYNERYTQAEIAKMVGVSQVQISRVITRIKNEVVPYINQCYNKKKEVKNMTTDNKNEGTKLKSDIIVSKEVTVDNITPIIDIIKATMEVAELENKKIYLNVEMR